MKIQSKASTIKSSMLIKASTIRLMGVILNSNPHESPTPTNYTRGCSSPKKKSHMPNVLPKYKHVPKERINKFGKVEEVQVQI